MFCISLMFLSNINIWHTTTRNKMTSNWQKNVLLLKQFGDLVSKEWTFCLSEYHSFIKGIQWLPVSVIIRFPQCINLWNREHLLNRYPCGKPKMPWTTETEVEYFDSYMAMIKRSLSSTKLNVPKSPHIFFFHEKKVYVVESWWDQFVHCHMSIT